MGELQQALVDLSLFPICKLCRFAREARGGRFWENDEIARSSVVADEVLDALEIRRDIIPVDTTLHRTDA